MIELKDKTVINQNEEEDQKFKREKRVRIVREYYRHRIHYGHRPNQLNPKMIPYLYKGLIIKRNARNKGHHMINIRLTNYLLNKTRQLVEKLASKDKIFLFVGTKLQLKSVVAKQAQRCQQYYINHRWLGGMLTNWQTMEKQIAKLKELEILEQNGSLQLLPIKEYNKRLKELNRLRACLSGIKDMPSIPDIVIVTHLRKDLIAVQECNSLGIPVIGIVDTDCDPDLVDYVIPANDDSTVSVDYILDKLSTSILNGYESSAKKVEGKF
jgi:small subunit ribosomal protein S2